MTPKEKANILSNSYVFKSVFDMDNDELNASRLNAKKCALIAVDEIINAIGTKCSDCQDKQNENLLYWIKVKQEIKLL